MAKLIVTHLRPDFDAAASVWMIRKYFPDFANAQVVFVPAGKTYQDMPADSDDKVVHVDTGLGRFDHHHLSEQTSATKRILDFLRQNRLLKTGHPEALDRLVDLTVVIDNFGEVNFPEPRADYHELSLYQLLEGYKYIEPDDQTVLEYALTAVESLYTILKQKVRAEKELKKGEEIRINDTRALVLETPVEDSMTLAQKAGYQLVIRRDPRSGRIRIKARPDTDIDLIKVYGKLTLKDGHHSWYYHSSGKMILNGSSKNPTMRPTRLTLKEVVKIVKENL